MDLTKRSWFPATEIGDLYCRACSGNQDAEIFLLLWHDLIHRIDDQIDEHKGDPEYILALDVDLAQLYSTDFYAKYRVSLLPIVVLITNAYGDSVHGERSMRQEDQKIADVLRCCGLEMALAIAFITGGFPLVRSLSMPLRRIAWAHHHIGEEKV